MKLIISLIAMIASTAVNAHGEHTIEQTVVTAVHYDTSAYNRGIHSYPILVPAEVISNINIIYVDKAVGPAIYSYPTNAK